MLGQPIPEPPPLQTLETRLERVEALIIELQTWLADVDLDHSRRMAEIRDRLDLEFAHMLDLLEEIRTRTGL